jgi:hypothetical protein
MTYRKVKFKKWIPIEYNGEPRDYSNRKAGTASYEKGFTGEGLFHQWASAYDHTNDGIGNYTVALVELFDGSIERVTPDYIIFIDKPNTNKPC